MNRQNINVATGAAYSCSTFKTNENLISPRLNSLIFKNSSLSVSAARLRKFSTSVSFHMETSVRNLMLYL